MSFKTVVNLDGIERAVKQLLDDEPFLKEIVLVKSDDTIFTIYASDKTPVFLQNYMIKEKPVSRDLLSEELFSIVCASHRPS
ncbi:hypothetical protein COV11_03510, partial [Candidatus Woesearchaeota archaeon CG10_big_fil_rev_8_21_14_0_10_30_7]